MWQSSEWADFLAKHNMVDEDGLVGEDWMIDYQLAIPSYQRENTLKQKTLRLLARYNINPQRVTIFVADERSITDTKPPWQTVRTASW